MKVFRKALFWAHLISGLAAGIVIFIMCVTGALLAFEKNIVEIAERGVRVVQPAPGAEPLAMSAILTAVKAARPESTPSSIAVSNDPGAAVTVSLGREGQLFVNPYTGEVREENASVLRSFFRTMTDLHRYIALSGDGRPIGKALTGVGNLLFLILAISGIYIWMPRKFDWRRVRPILWFRRGTSGKARDFNWHTTIGFWCSSVLIILTLTATVISYQWASNLVYTLTGNQPPASGPRLQGGPPADVDAEPAADVDRLWETASAFPSSWKSISMRLPVAKEAVFTIDEGRSWNIFGRSTLTLDPSNAQVAKWEPYSEQNSGRQLRSWMRFTHTGETGGLVGQFIAFVACIGGAFLVCTGFSLALRRFGNWRSRRQNSVPA